MDQYVEFSGKDLDQAIASACSHFGIERDRLEIEIVSGGSSGIFGLVGVKKAVIMARARSTGQTEETAQDKPARQLKPRRKNTRPPRQSSQVQETLPSEQKPASTPESIAQQPETVAEQAVSAQEDPIAEKPAHEDNAVHRQDFQQEDQPDQDQEEHQVRDRENEQVHESDPQLKKFIEELIVSLTSSLTPEAVITVHDQSRPINVTIQDQNASQVLIGRDGQTLSAIQYIANRIIARKCPGAPRVQLDTQNFLEKQTEKLQKNAQQLASKAKKAGKTMSTRPLSSYHRRIVHMTLQDDKKIRTKSKGDGPMKRVLIMPRTRRKKPSQD
ncbi:MAG: protein jag [Desulfonatronovibrionaceae bacterium]